METAKIYEVLRENAKRLNQALDLIRQSKRELEYALYDFELPDSFSVKDENKCAEEIQQLQYVINALSYNVKFAQKYTRKH